MNQHTFGRIAHRGAGALGIIENGGGHIQIGLIVHIDVAHALTGADHRHAGLFGHCPNEPRAAPGDQHVHIPIQMHQLARGFVAGVLHQGNAVGGKASLDQSAPHQLHGAAVGADGLLAAPENAHIAGFQAQGRRVHRDVGPGLKDDGDHTQGDPPPSDNQAVGAGFHSVHPADGVRQSGHLPHAVHDPGDPLRRERQPVQHGRAHPGLPGCRHVLGIGGQPVSLALNQGLGHGFQCGVFHRCGGSGKRVRGGFCRCALLLQYRHKTSSFFRARNRVPISCPSTIP